MGETRHTFSSHLVMRGANLRSVQELLGHKTGKMTVRYTHLSTPHLQETVNLLDNLFVPAPHGVEQGREPAHEGHSVPGSQRCGRMYVTHRRSIRVTRSPSTV
jgi:hypothetical protein